MISLQSFSGVFLVHIADSGVYIEDVPGAI